jgi:hypothetical protein
MPPTPHQQAIIHWATNWVNDAGKVFQNIPAARFLNDLADRIVDPRLIDQRHGQVCGPAAFMYGLVRSHPEQYAAFACHLFMFGAAQLNDLHIKAPDSVKGAALHTLGMSTADWVTLASLRRSKNWMWRDLSTLRAGLTWPLALKKWFNQAGFEAHSHTSLVSAQDWDNWDRACDLYETQNAIVCVFINTHMLDARTCGERSYAPNHWVALANIRSRRNPVDIDFFTWGGTMPVRYDQAHEHDFRRHYYGYVSAVVP